MRSRAKRCSRDQLYWWRDGGGIRIKHAKNVGIHVGLIAGAELNTWVLVKNLDKIFIKETDHTKLETNKHHDKSKFSAK